MNIRFLKTIWLITSAITAVYGCGPDKLSSSSIQMGGSTQGVPLSLANEVSTFAGGTSGAQNGIGTAAQFIGPAGITTDGTSLYVTESNHTIRKIDIATRAVTILAGIAGSPGSTDCTVGTSASFALPLGITTDGTNLYVADTGNHTIRKIVIGSGAVATFAGIPGVWGVTDCTVGIGATFNNPYGITTDGNNIYVADTHNNAIRKIAIATGAVTTLAGGNLGSADNVGLLASFNYPVGVTTDGTNLYVTDAYNYTIRKIVIASGAVTTLAGSAGNPGVTDNTGELASFSLPFGITTDGTNIYVTESSEIIRKIVIASRVVTTLAGTAFTQGFNDNVGLLASFYNPLGITTDGNNLYVADDGNNAIRKIR